MEVSSRRLDPHAVCRVTALTLGRYRKHALLLSNWATSKGLAPVSDRDWDATLLEYKNFHTKLRKTDFTTTVASVEFFFPELRGRLSMSHTAIRGWEISHRTKHTVPMGRAVATLFATHMAARGNPRLGAALFLQVRKGLRPGELFDIRREDLVLPSDTAEVDQDGFCMIGLGVRVGTKAKRAQSVVVNNTEHPQLITLLERLAATTAPGARIFPYTIEQYRSEIKSIELSLGLEFGFGPHSPRAGFASEGRARGMSFIELREAGRWVADSSLRVYIDIVSASAISVSLRSKGLLPALTFAAEHALQYFEVAQLAILVDTRFRRR